LRKNDLVIAFSNSFNKDIAEQNKNPNLKNWGMVHYLNFSIFENENKEVF
jgi:hypothetical protein